MNDQNPNDLIKRLNEALQHEGEEVSADVNTEGNMTLINIRRKPSGEATWYTAEDGSMIYEWKDKFPRQERGMNPPFQFGDKLRLSGFVETDSNALYKIHIDADGRVADNFFLASVPQPDPLKEFLGMPLEVIVEVVDERKSEGRLSNVYNYDARFVEIASRPLINPNQEDLENVTPGKRVVVKGKFLGFGDSGERSFLRNLGYPDGSRIAGVETGRITKLSITLPDGKTEEKMVEYTPNDYLEESTYGVIETDEGRKIRVRMPTGMVTFSGGVLECLTGGTSNRRDRKLPEKGDYVTIGAFVSRFKELGVHWCDPCLLNKPSQAREQRYNDLRATIETQIGRIGKSISEGIYADSRKFIGDARALELTRSELESVSALTQSLPESERPVQSPKDEYNPEGRRHFYAEAIDDAYETRLESMTLKEFIDFTKSAISGDKKQIGKHADTSYLFAIAQDFGVDQITREEIAVACLEARLGRIRGKPYNHDTDWDDKYNIDQALKYLAAVGNESSTNRLFSYLKNFVEGGDFHEAGWRDKRGQRPEDFVFAAVEAINGHVRQMPRDIVQRELPYLQHLLSYLSEFADEPVTVDVLDMTVNYIQGMDSQGNL
jgi:hypothetical protein